MFLLLPLSVYAQNTNEAKKTDTLTYALYMKAAWGELIETGENALDEGTDFYYLRMRIGIAYYNEKDYMSAAPHFRKALAFIPNDPAASEYLYWSYIFSGREADARVLASNFTSKFLKDIGAKPQSFIGGIYVEGGFMSNADFTDSTKSGFGKDSLVYGEIKPENNSTYFSVNVNFVPSSRFTVFTGYNNLNLNNKKMFVSTGNSPGNFNLKTKQNEFYLNAGVYAGAGFTLSGIVHYLNIKTEDVTASVNKMTGAVTYTQASETLDNYVGMFAVAKSLGKFRLSLGSSYSNLNKAKQIQNTLSVVYFPLGNLNFYSVTDLTAHSQKKDDTLKNSNGKFMTRGIVNQKIGFKVFDKLWLEGFYMFGNAENYNESSAFVVFNSMYTMNNRLGVNLLAPLSSSVQLSLRYQYYNLEITELAYDSPSTYSTITKTNKFHKIIGGLKWTF